MCPALPVLCRGAHLSTQRPCLGLGSVRSVGQGLLRVLSGCCQLPLMLSPGFCHLLLGCCQCSLSLAPLLLLLSQLAAGHAAAGKLLQLSFQLQAHPHQ